MTFTVSFEWSNNTEVFAKGVRKENKLIRINTPKNVANLFRVNLSEGILVNDSENAIIIEATDNANRQSIHIDIDGGYFAVYVNGNKVEDLGRLIRVDNETELETFRLCGGNEGLSKLIIYLSDLNITGNGDYNVMVSYISESSEVELFNKNLTLTSNVKVDNVTSDVFTGFGMDPVLFYLDTYYGDINETRGTVTVLNSTENVIFTSDIRRLSKDDDGRYYLKYSDFENKNFGDTITVMYSNGNERSGNTTVNVTWKDVDSEVFNPVIDLDVNDYYGDFINMDIPDLLNDGQIIVTIKFKGNHTTNIPDMNVYSDFGSQAVYKFNIADIKTHYDTFKLSLSDLGFYEDDGNYDITVQFTADGTDVLDVADSTMKVEFLGDILISTDENSRYSYELPFAGVRVFEPVSAYADLYIDGMLYMHKTFEKGAINFTSSKSWTPGVHTAELKVIHSEFGSVLNSSTAEFETLIKTSDVEVSATEDVKENEPVKVDIKVAQAGKMSLKIDDGAEKVYQLFKGSNQIDLGLLNYGNHSIWIDYNASSDDGSTSFYTGPVSVFVGDDGHWLKIPEPVVLNDDDTIKINLGEGASGYILIYIDNKLVTNRTLENGAAEYRVTDEIFAENYPDNLLRASAGENKYGKHSYKIFYSGDSTHDSLTKEGEFSVAYIFKDNLEDEYPLREFYDMTVSLPDDAKGTVKLTVNNKNYTSEVRQGSAKFKIDNLNMNAHNVFIEYIGDDYPYAGYAAVLNVSYYGVVGEYSSDAKYVSLMLPENAKGNLTVYNDNMHSVIKSSPLSKGFAKIDLSDLTVGIYDIRAYYEGDDYDVKSFATSFRVMPKVIIAQGIIMGDNGNIYLDLDNATGHVVIAMDGLSPVVQELNNGIINYTFTTEGYSKGNHTVTFMYFGKSFDGSVFYEEDGKTPIKYDMLVLPQETTGDMKSEGDIYTVTVYDAEGNIAYDAKGTIEFFINGTRYVVDIVNGIASIDVSMYKNGNYHITWTYSGDNKYDTSSGQLDMNINRKIVAKNKNIMYLSNGKYSVTVYNKEKPEGGVKVIFSIKGKVLKTVTTNSKGIASVVIKKSPGTYKITAKALGLSKTKTLKVTHVLSLKKVNVKKSAKKLVIKATLKKVKGKYLKGKKITLKFNGKKYTAKTDKKGVAKFTIKSKVLKKLKVGKKIKYQATYLKDTVKQTVKVKK